MRRQPDGSQPEVLDRLDDLDEPIAVDRLHDIAVRVEAVAAHDVRLGIRGGQDHDGNVSQRGIALDVFQHLLPGPPGKIQIQQDEIGRQRGAAVGAPQQRDGLLAVPGNGHMVQDLGFL